MVIGRAVKGKNYIRYRIRSPRVFKKGTFRTLDIGRPRKHMIIRGIRKKTGKWETQSILVEKGTADGMTKKLIERAMQRKREVI